MYLPFIHPPFLKAQSHSRMGLKSLSIEDWIVLGSDFCAQLAEKQQLLQHHYDDVFVAQDSTQAAQQEVLSLLVDHLLQRFPGVYKSIGEGEGASGIRNLNTQEALRYADFAHAPLDLAGRLVAEDLCLMMPAESEYCLAAASVCFPQQWTLREKFGKPMSHIHSPVPDYSDMLARPVGHVFSRLRESFPGVRFNWSVVDSPALYMGEHGPKRRLLGEVTADSAGHSLWLRVERQTIRRLPVSGGVLFTIRTFVYPLSQVVEVPDAAKQLEIAVRSLTEEMQVYKNLLPFRTALLDYLRARSLERTSRNAVMS